MGKTFSYNGHSTICIAWSHTVGRHVIALWLILANPCKISHCRRLSHRCTDFDLWFCQNYLYSQSTHFSVFSFKSKQKSEPQVVTHGDELTLGSTTLHLHIHPGSQTCDSCEPGQVQAQVLNQAPAGGTSFDQDDEGTWHAVWQSVFLISVNYYFILYIFTRL